MFHINWQDIQQDLEALIPIEMLSKIALLADIEWLTAAYLYLQQASIESTAFTKFPSLSKQLCDVTDGVGKSLYSKIT